MKLIELCLLLIVLLMSACSDEGMLGTGTDPASNTETETASNTGTGALPNLARHNSGFRDMHYSGSGQCSNCHDGLTDEAGTDVSIVQDWSSSMMANAARDPYWIAKVAAEIDRNPALKTTLDDTCSRCHAPMANDVAHKDSIAFAITGSDAVLSEQNPLFDHAMEGVSCTLCHQIQDDGLLGSIAGVSGNFSVQQMAIPADRPAFGSYTDPSGAFMQAQTQFNPVYGAHISTSEFCAACHDLRTPSVDAEGNLLGAEQSTFFPEQMVYSEWANSDYRNGGSSAKTCQACHMPTAVGSVQIATQGGGFPRPNFSTHTFLGANTVMQTMLKNFSDELGINVAADQFDQSIARNRTFLSGAALLQITSSSLLGQELVASVHIENQAGHKLPSGYPSRRVYIHLTVKDSADNVVFESGRLNADGSVVGIATDSDSSRYENHFETITESDQVQVYEAIMGDSNATITHTLLRATHYLKDNRLLPAGFDKTSASDDIKVAGLAVADTDFDAGGDTVEYRIPVSAGDVYTVRAELIYQPLAYGHIQDLFSSIHVPEVDQFKTLFDASTLKAEVIAVDSITVR